MTDKTALLALADEMVQVLAQTPAREMSRTHDVIGGWQRALRALAAQPAGAIAIHQVQWHEDNRTEWEDTSDPSSFDGPNWKHRTVFTAPPAASVDVEGLRSLAKEMLDEVSVCDDIGILGTYVVGVSNKITALINSAGGAKGEQWEPTWTSDAYTIDHCNKEATPQPDGGDGAVLDAELDDLVLQYGNARAHGLMDEAAEIYTQISCRTRPSAAAAVPDAMVVPYGSESGDKDYTYGYEKGRADGWNACRDKVLAALAQQEPRHYALADGEAASA